MVSMCHNYVAKVNILEELFQFYHFIATNPSPSTLGHVTPWTAARQAPLSMDFSR